MQTDPYVRPQGIFRSVQSMFSTAAEAVDHTAKAMSEGAEALEVLARTGKRMAENNEEYLMERSRFERDRKIKMLMHEMTAYEDSEKEFKESK